MRSAERWPLLVVVGLLCPVATYACTCVSSTSICQDYRTTDLIFSGRVEDIQPRIDERDPAVRQKLLQLFSPEELEDIYNSESPDVIRRIKKFYAEALPEPLSSQIRAASTAEQLEKLIEPVLEDKRVTLRVFETYKGFTTGETQTIRTSFSSCGASFVRGETYLVHAWKDDQGRYVTTACSRTRRLSHAGADLAYLQHVKLASPNAARIHGFLTSAEKDLHRQLHQDRVTAPVRNAVVRLSSEGTDRLDTSDEQGRFVFDGLPAGTYQLRVMKSYRVEEIPLAARTVQVDTNGCREELFYLPGESPKVSDQR